MGWAGYGDKPVGDKAAIRALGRKRKCPKTTLWDSWVDNGRANRTNRATKFDNREISSLLVNQTTRTLHIAGVSIRGDD